jgi:Zn ribbon nucleic-acid-binding protein
MLVFEYECRQCGHRRREADAKVIHNSEPIYISSGIKHL